MNSARIALLMYIWVRNVMVFMYFTYSLATIHASAFAYQNALGGRTSFLSRFPLIKEDNMPRAKLMKSTVDDLLEPYLEYMGLVAPEIGPQMAFLKKFSRFLLPIFHDFHVLHVEIYL